MWGFSVFARPIKADKNTVQQLRQECLLSGAMRAHASVWNMWMIMSIWLKIMEIIDNWGASLTPEEIS